MNTSNEFSTTKSLLVDYLHSIDLNDALINQMLTDEFINGLLELDEQKPQNNKFISLLQNFSHEQSLNTLLDLEKELIVELSYDSYVSKVFRYFKDEWSDIIFPDEISRSLLSAGKRALSGLGSALTKFANSPAFDIYELFDGMSLWGKMIRWTHKSQNEYYDIMEGRIAKDEATVKGYQSLVKNTEKVVSPLIIDLDGDGIETTTTEDGVYFDHDNNGFAEKTGWVGKDDGLLVRDINGNGQIDNGTELFGNNTILSNGQKAANGFEALKDLDSNNDGQFNSSDAAWSEVKVWKDTNQNGKIDSGELLTLEQAGVESIDLNYENSDSTDINGNKIGQTSSFDRENGSKGNISDIWFNTDLINTLDKTQIDIPEDIKALPNVIGFGNVHDLHTAMALDTTGALKNLVEQYAAETDIAIRESILYNIIYHWTGVQNMDPNGRDPTQVYGKVIDDTRKLEAIEEFMGEDYLGTWCWGERDPNPHGQAAPYILRAFEILADHINNELLKQTHYKPLMEEVKLLWNETTQSWDVDVNSAVNSIQNIYNVDANKGILIFREFESLVKNCGYNNLQSIYDAFRLLGDEEGNTLDVMISKFGLTYGTEWDDKLTGTDSVDDIQGLAGNDSIYGGAGNDTLDGGTGNDNLFGEDGNDILIGGAGNDYLIGGNGADTYIFNPGFGNDAIDNSDDNASASEPDIIQFGEGILPSKTTLGRQGYDLIITVSYDPDEDGNTLPNDSVRIYSYFDQQGTSSTTVNSIVFADGTSWDYNYVRDHWNSIPGVNGGVTLEGNNQDNTLNGTDYNDILIGNGGNDTIYGGAGNDRILGGSGNDTLDGGYGDDTYLWNWGDGMDTIIDNGNHDKISFGSGISFADLKFRQEGNNLRIIVKNSESQGMLLTDFFRGLNYKIEDLYFHDGSIVHLSEIPLTLHQLNTAETINLTGNGDTVYANGGNDTINGGAAKDTIYAGSGNDTVYANGGDDFIVGGTGNDRLEGGAGNDTYIYNVGDGLDTIWDYQYSSTESRADKIKFGEGIDFEDITFRREGNNLVITLFNDSTQGIIIEQQFYDDNRSIEYLEFADGTIKNLKEMGFTFQQTDGHDTISGTNYNDIIYGNGGNDTIYANGGDDLIIGGKGNDRLEGGAGNDTYIYNVGDGLDTIWDYQYSSTESRADKIKFGEGIDFEDLTFRREGNNLVITLFNDSTQGIIIEQQFYDDNRSIEYLEFADGTIKNLKEMGFTYIMSDSDDNVSGTNYNDTISGNGGNDTIYGGNGDDILIGGKGNDYIEGGAGNDTYIWNLGDGFDTFADYQSSNTEGRADKVKFGEGISFDDLTFERSGNHLNIYVNGDKNQGVQLYNQFYDDYRRIEYLEFADNSIKNLTEIGLTLTQHDGSETIDGTNYDDIIYANGGNDTVNAGNGDDTIYGGDGNDTINSGNGNDTLIGGKGNDNLNGGAGNDTYIYNVGDGFDTISEASGTDKIVLGEGISPENLTFERSGNNLNIYINNDKTQGFQLYNQFYDSSRMVETLEFADGSTFDLTKGLTFNQHNGSETINGTDYDDIIYGNGGNDTIEANSGNDTIYGGAGNDIIRGHNGNDIIEGGVGNDALDGGNGDDTYIYNLGDGFDTIYDASGSDKIKFGEGIEFDDLTFRVDGNNLYMFINGDETQGIMIYNMITNSSFNIETLEFADGSTKQLSAMGLTLQQHNGSETINGTNYDDVIYGNGGDDTIEANSGNDTIYGGAGNDIIRGHNGNDIIEGGVGNDALDGGNGDDTYIYNLGDGFDTIYDASGSDKIKFGEGIEFDDLTFRVDGNNLYMFINGDETQGIMIYNMINNSSFNIETLEFADGSTKQLSAIGLTLQQHNGSETINGTDYDDVIYGNGGNDILNGGNGNDILSGGTGHDHLNGGAGDDTYIWNLNDGIDTISDSQGTNKIQFGTGITPANLSFAQVGNNLRIIVNNNPSQGLIIENYYSNDERYKIDIMEFADGSEASVTDFIGNLVSLPDQIINGTADDDILTGGNGNDTINAGDGYNDITGGKGNDILNGGYDKDIYYYNVGDGYDIISDPYGRDKIVFGTGISPSDLILQKEGNDLFISFSSNDNDSIRILQHFYDDDRKIEQLEFADGSIMNLSKGLILHGTDSDNSINGTSYDDTIYGNLGRDVINGGAGADTIIGGKGDDTINGGVGEDTIIWNLGDDMDTVTFSDIDHLKFGEGITFDDLTFYEEGNNLKIVVKGDITQGVICYNYFYSNDYKPENIIFADGSTFSIHSSGLIIHHSDKSESISGTDYADTIYGGKGNDTISGGNGNDIIYGGDGDDTINGGNGTDTIVGGKGNDTINGGTDADTYIWNLGDDLDTITASNIDTLQFGEGVTKDNLTFRSEGNNLRIIVNNDETQGIILVNFFYDTNYKLNNVKFANGSTFNLATTGLTLDQHYSRGDTINGTAYDDIINAENTYSVTINAGDGSDDITAGDGNDTVNAGNGNNVIRGGKGNDTLTGGSGDDTYIYNLGDGVDTISDSSGNDKIIFGTGILPEDLTFTQNGNSLRITINGDAFQGIEIINYYNSANNQIEKLQFADGTILLLPEMDITLQQGEHSETINGTNSNETIYGNGGNDTINGGYGNDIIIGGAGNDVLNGGGDDDTYIYNLGDGLDTISDNAGSNKIVFGEGITQSSLSFTQIGNNLLIYLNGDKNQGIVINSFFNDDSYKIGEIHFADNSVFYLSETGLTLDQSDRTDNMTINGTDYDDTIIGGLGNDTINAGDDDDVLIGGKGNDILNGGYGRDTYIYNLGDGVDTIYETRGNDKIKFGSGIVLNNLKFTQEGNDLRITVKNDVNQSILIKSFYSNVNYQVEKLEFANGSTFNLSTQGLTLQQTNADETINGTSYNDVIYGNGGHDTINAGEGNDTIIGGIGNDTLNGGDGNDTYIYNLGDGFDTITETGGNDKIVFGAGITQNDLSFEQIGNHLKISINGDEIKGIQINNQFGSSSYQVETIMFHDGSTLNISNADQLIQAMNSFSLSNSASTDTLSNPTQDVSDMYSLAANSDLTRKAI